jgi:hypothetical protein
MELTYECSIQGLDAQLVVAFDYELEVAAKISGPVEQCHPAEGGVATLNAVYLSSDSEAQDLLPFFSQRTQDTIKEVVETWAREAQAAGEL